MANVNGANVATVAKAFAQMQAVLLVLAAELAKCPATVKYGKRLFNKAKSLPAHATRVEGFITGVRVAKAKATPSEVAARETAKVALKVAKATPANERTPAQVKLVAEYKAAKQARAEAANAKFLAEIAAMHTNAK